jgi:hypothetical protein
MNTVRRVAPVLLAALLASGLAACSQSGSPTAAGPSASKPVASPSAADPLAKLTAVQAFDQAIADTVNAPDVHFGFSDTISGADNTPILQDVTLEIARGKGCTGTVYEDTLKNGPIGTFQVIVLGTTVWTKPDATFWQNIAQGHPDSPEATTMLALNGKYVQDSVGGTSDFAQLGTLCNVLPESLKTPSSVGMNGTLTKDGLSPYNGQQVLTVMDVSQNAYALVSDTSAPLLVEVAPPSGTGLGNLSFSDYGQPVTITAPPSSEVVSGSQYGL